MKRLLLSIVALGVLTGCPPPNAPETRPPEGQAPASPWTRIHEHQRWKDDSGWHTNGPDVWRMPMEGGWLVAVGHGGNGAHGVTWIPGSVAAVKS